MESSVAMRRVWESFVGSTDVIGSGRVSMINVGAIEKERTYDRYNQFSVPLCVDRMYGHDHPQSL